MCCLFGILNYSGKTNKELNTLINCLSREATVRGTDSTGIAYNKDGKLKIYKKPLSAYDMEFVGVEDCISISGHTRHATQGSKKKNYNNHPFMAYCNNVKFALSHNGVLWNDRALRQQYNICKNKIETDSYIAVQLLEHFGDLNFTNIKKMAEAVKGSFAFTMNDTQDNLYLVKGDSPLSIIHLPQAKMYVYASTDNILFTALSQTDFVDDIKSGDFKMVTIKSGDIFKIDKYGRITKDKFRYDYTDSYFYDWRKMGLNDYSDYNYFDDYDDITDTPNAANYNACNYYEIELINELKTVAGSMGFDKDYIDTLLAEGFTLDEIEDYIYDEYSYCTKVV